MAKTKSLYEPILIETAWEVCNQVGGIYTVVRSKVPHIVNKWGEQYCMIGPLLQSRTPAEFEEAYDYNDIFGETVLEMRKLGYEVHYGRWLTDGRPRVVLLSPFQVYDQMRDIRADLLTRHQINVSNPDELLEQVIAFGHLVAIFFRELEELAMGRTVLAHFHEWMTGMPVGEIRARDSKIITVFTTHATMLGRYIAGSDDNFYRNLSTYKWLEMAQKFYIEPQVRLERLATESCNVFTTVSDITGKECEYLLGRKPDLILPNGISLSRFLATHELQNLHAQFSEKIDHFVISHFFHSYTFDLDHTLYFFTSGRYEYHNKGYDLTLEALKRLNERMKKENVGKTVVMFFITKRPYTTINPLVLHARASMDDIRDTCEEMLKIVREKLFLAAATSITPGVPNLNDFIDDYWKFRYRKQIQSWKSDFWPIVVTHNLKDDKGDEILSFIRENDMINKPTDKVKIVYHPDFVAPTSPLFGMDYPQFVRGCHLGIFPSYYEPWGYTPLECVARGVPSVTSDLSGFGNYCQTKFRHIDEKGIYIVRRKNKTYDESADELCDILFNYVQLSRRERIILRNTVESYAENFGWTTLIANYEKAYHLALQQKD